MRWLAKHQIATATPPANLVAALGPACDGGWSWEDCDPGGGDRASTVTTLDTDACLRVLLADVGHFTMARKAARRCCPSARP